MKVKLRILLLSLVGVAVIATLYILFQWRYPQFHAQNIQQKELVYSLSKEDEHGEIFTEPKKKKPDFSASKCDMENCFDFQKCISGFKVYVYPFENGERVSSNYANIIRVIKKSVYYTNNPSEACLFVSSYDTTDQDVLSRDYVKDLGNKITNLPHWNGGRNHIIFNLYSGTWPDYKETLDFNSGQAILVKASFNAQYYRSNFDISFPLFEKSQELFNGGNLPHSDNVFPVLKKHKLVFKGKRYLSGIGGESRASLHHIHNNEDIIMLTTCRHGVRWKMIKDDRCDHDNELYDRYCSTTFMVITN